MSLKLTIASKSSDGWYEGDMAGGQSASQHLATMRDSKYASQQQMGTQMFLTYLEERLQQNTNPGIQRK